jgi:hypothetical protein
MRQATIEPRILNLLCQGAGGFGGQDWEGPHLVGRLLLGHTAREEIGGWDRQVIMRTAPRVRQPDYSGQIPPKVSGWSR